MNGKCFDEIDTKLREKNLKLVGYAHVMPAFRLVPTVETAWLDKTKSPRGQKKSPPKMFASHCPFCGKPVEPKEKKIKTTITTDAKPGDPVKYHEGA